MAAQADPRTMKMAVLEQREIDALRAQADRQAVERARQLREFDPDNSRGGRALDRIVERFRIESGEQSGRNRALAGAAWAAGRLVAGGELREADAKGRLMDEAVMTGLPEREASYVVSQQFRRARSKPRAFDRSHVIGVSLKVRL